MQTNIWRLVRHNDRPSVVLTERRRPRPLLYFHFDLISDLHTTSTNFCPWTPPGSTMKQLSLLLGVEGEPSQCSILICSQSFSLFFKGVITVWTAARPDWMCCQGQLWLHYCQIRSRCSDSRVVCLFPINWKKQTILPLSPTPPSPTSTSMSRQAIPQDLGWRWWGGRGGLLVRGIMASLTGLFPRWPSQSLGIAGREQDGT